MTDHERDQAIKEGHRNAAAEAYLKPRKDFRMQRAQLFEAGFDRGYDAAAAPPLERIAEMKALAESEGSRAVEYLRRARAAEAKLAQRVPDDFLSHKESWRNALVLAEECADTDDDVAYWQHELRAYDKAHAMLSAAPAAPEQQEPTDSMGMPVSCGKPLCSPGDHHPLCTQAPNAQQAELPPGWKTVVVPEDVGPEPDWEDVRYQAETATGINLPRAVFSIVIREVRRWLAAQQAEAQEPVATINISDDDFDLGLTDDYAFGIKRLPNGEHQLFTRPQPAQLQALSDGKILELIEKYWNDPTTTANVFAQKVQSALAAKNGTVLK